MIPGKARLSGSLARFSHHLTVKAHSKPAITTSHLLAVPNGLSQYARIIHRDAAPSVSRWALTGFLTLFASPLSRKAG